MMRIGFIVGLAFASACVVAPAPVQSTASVLGPARSAVVVGQPQRDAALGVVKLFSSRGYALTSAKTMPNGDLFLRISGARRTATVVDEGSVALASVLNLDNDNYWRDQISLRKDLERQILLGSAFYVSVSPMAAEQSAIAIIGRPMHEGREACTSDLPNNCVRLGQSDAPTGELMSYAESEVIEGVFAELRISGLVLSPDPAAHEEAFARADRCHARRLEVQAAADRVTNPQAKAGILRTLPTCDPAAISQRE